MVNKQRLASKQCTSNWVVLKWYFLLFAKYFVCLKNSDRRKLLPHHRAPTCTSENFLFQVTVREHDPSSALDISCTRPQNAEESPQRMQYVRWWAMLSCRYEGPQCQMWRLEWELPCWRQSAKMSTESGLTHSQATFKKVSDPSTDFIDFRFKRSSYFGCRSKFPTIQEKGRNCMGSICKISASLNMSLK